MANGKVIQVIGSVVDVEFSADSMPALFNALEIPRENGKMVLEVQSHVGNNRVKCLSFTPTDGLERGAEVIDTTRPLSVPVGRGTLGRIFNVLGEALDNRGDVKSEKTMPIHRLAPGMDELESSAQVLETGIKVIDLIAPFARGGKIGALGGAGVGKTVLIQELIRNIATEHEGF
ncbi:ATP synthase subunit beta, partial [Dehalococcoides mccartyi]